MAISTLDGYVGAAKQKVQLTKTQVATSVAAAWSTVFDRAGAPGAGSLAIGNTTTGVVPTDATAGAPDVQAFGSGAVGYLGAVEFANTVACRMYLYDRLFHAGSFSTAAATTFTLSSQPSYAARDPSNVGAGLEIWLEVATALAAASTVTVTYTNQAGVTGRSTGVALTGAAAVGRMYQCPLQAGDTGVQAINSVIIGGTVGTGAVNVIVARPLWAGRVPVANGGDTHGIDKTGMPRIYADSCLALAVCADSTSTGVPDLLFDVING